MKFLLENEKIDIVPESDSEAYSDNNHYVEQSISDNDVDTDEEYVKNEFKKSADFLIKSGNKAWFDVYASGDTIQADFDFEFTEPKSLDEVQGIVDDLRNCGDISLFMISFTFSDGSEKSIHDEYDYENFYTEKSIKKCSVSFLFLTEDAYDFNFDDYLDESLGLKETSSEDASQASEMEQAKNISHLIFDNHYGNKSVKELDVDSINDIDHYYKLIRDVDEAERFNYHSDHWGYDEDYQEQNIDLIDTLTPYINKQVEIDYEDGSITGKLLGIAIDKQYNSISHTKVILDSIEELNEALEKAETEEEKQAIEKEIEEIDAKIDYADDHGMSKDHLIDEIDALNESVESYIYLFPELTYEDKEQLDNYNLTLLGRNRFEDEVNSVVKGSKEDLEFYAKDYLDYQLHPDYLYIENDFAGEIEPDMFEDFDIEGDVDFSVETPNKLTIEDVKEIAMEHYEDGGDVVIETMTDEDIQNWIEQDGTRDGLMNMFRDNLSIYQDRKAREYDDYHYEPEIEVSETEEDVVEPGEIIDDPLLPDEFEYDDDISDFGPGNPWDAPGMNVKDFLR